MNAPALMPPAILDIPHAGQTWRIHCRPPRRNNRRLRLTIEADGKIYLSHPSRSKPADILRFINEHLDWIAARARSQEAALPSPYADGSTHWLLGEPLRLLLSDDAPRDIRHEGDILIAAPGDEDALAAAFRRFHQQQSAAHLPAMVAHEAARCPWVREQPPLRYRAMRRSWGNCRRDGILTFNTRLIQYPPALIAHVIIHELCHLQEHHHGAAFYALMQAVQPDWQARKASLERFRREHGVLM